MATVENNLSRLVGNGREPILIAGPTASGKSEIALRLAETHGGIVINADSMQVYRELRIVTARPTYDEEKRAPHILYGHVPAAEAYSVARWLSDVRHALEDAQRRELRPIIVGGTGLYFKGLLEGLSPIPDIPDTVRSHWRTEAARLGVPALHALLSQRDPEMGERLAPRDMQRIVRALEVLDGTGRSLAHWHAQPGQPVIQAHVATRLVIDIPRDRLYQRCDDRLDLMIAGGALAEVGELAALRLPPSLPAMQALGVPSLLQAVSGEIALPAAIADAKLRTRQYAKRQLTWLRKHMNAWRSFVL